ncbi:MAG TPA: SDR family NAD(P)-dependent oxidoreductase [Lichenihabitans sp.]|jgi:NADP-dependent 3-hydroxy acid dehydrogenase YdfG|nr:SDR family NAD(P)-dependent oxidoreductase [Lichenihabitans sp.]
MGQLDGKIAWVTGAGSGVGEAAALALAQAGASVALTGRRTEPLESVARRIEAAGGQALVAAGDVSDRALAAKVVEAIEARFGRLDILINNAGTNVTARRWDQLSTEGIDQVLGANLSAAFYCAVAALKPMRRQRDGVLIHTASWAGKYISPLSGPAYTAAKHAVVAMSQTINIEDYVNGIRSTVMLPAEIATPILDTRPKPPSPAERAKMLQPRDMADLILFIATRPASVCLNEVVISPTANRIYSL